MSGSLLAAHDVSWCRPSTSQPVLGRGPTRDRRRVGHGQHDPAGGWLGHHGPPQHRRRRATDHPRGSWLAAQAPAPRQATHSQPARCRGDLVSIQVSMQFIRCRCRQVRLLAILNTQVSISVDSVDDFPTLSSGISAPPCVKPACHFRTVRFGRFALVRSTPIDTGKPGARKALRDRRGMPVRVASRPAGDGAAGRLAKAVGQGRGRDAWTDSPVDHVAPKGPGSPGLACGSPRSSRPAAIGCHLNGRWAMR